MNALYSSRCIDSNKKKSRDITKEYVLRHFCESFSTQNLCSCPKAPWQLEWSFPIHRWHPKHEDDLWQKELKRVVFTILLHMWEVYIFCVDIIFWKNCTAKQRQIGEFKSVVADPKMTSFYWNGHNLFVHQLLGLYLRGTHSLCPGGCPLHVGRNTYHCCAA